MIRTAPALWSLVACSGEPAERPPPAPRPTDPAPTTDPGDLVDVTVVNGEGDGAHLPGGELFVAATLDPTTQRVTGWTAEPALGTPSEWNGTIEVPSTPVTLTAHLRGVPVDLVDDTWTLGGRDVPVRIAVASPSVGVVSFFHGAAYSVAQLDEPAARSVLLHLVDAGYTVVAAPSQAELVSGTGGWVASDGSADHGLAADLWDHVDDAGLSPNGGLRAAWGMSSGGQFAHAVGRALDLDAVLAHCAPGSSGDLAATRAATGWFLAERDGTFPTAVDDAIAAMPGMVARGVTTQLYVHPRTPVTPLRFTRVPGVDDARSRALGQALLDRGLAGDDRLLREPGSTVVSAMSDLLDGDDAVRTGLGAELEILAADHEVYDDAANSMVDFLEQVRRR